MPGLTDKEKVAAYERASITGFAPIITKQKYENLKMSIRELDRQRANKRVDTNDGIDDIDKPLPYSSKRGRPSTLPTRTRARKRTRARARKRTRSRARTRANRLR